MKIYPYCVKLTRIELLLIEVGVFELNNLEKLKKGALAPFFLLYTIWQQGNTSSPFDS